MYKYVNDMLPELFVNMFIPAQNFMITIQEQLQNSICMLPFMAQLVARNVLGILEHTYGILYSLKWIRIVP